MRSARTRLQGFKNMRERNKFKKERENFNATFCELVQVSKTDIFFLEIKYIKKKSILKSY